MKHCNKCGELKPLSDFHRESQSSDGLKHTCKVCRSAYERSDARVAARRKYHQSIAAKKNNLKYQRSDAGKAVRARTLEKFPFRTRAQRKVAHAVNVGVLRRSADQPCSVASSACDGRHEYHHDSYLEADWLNVRVLCGLHHGEWHRHNKPTPHDGGQ